MSRITNLTLDTAGTYYTTVPTVLISPPSFDSANYVYDSSDYKFGGSSIVLDSNDVVIAGTLDSSYGNVPNQRVELSFFIKPTQLEPATLVWSDDLRIVMDSSGNVGVTFFVADSNKDAHSIESTATRYHSGPLKTTQWNFVHFELLQNTIRIGVDSDFFAATISGLSNYPFDSGDIIRFGHDSGDVSPISTKNGIGRITNKGFTGRLDNFTFTKASGAFDSASVRHPDSANDYYKDQTPEIQNTFDYRSATAIASIDSATGVVTSISITDSGYGYTSAPTVTFLGGNIFTDSSYAIGDSIGQTIAGGVIMSGEVMKYQLDSSLDSNRYLYIGHSGANDGKFHSFISNSTMVTNSTEGTYTGLKVTGVIEQNNISNNEQNDDFSNFSDDFLDFSEDNPFGDPEAQ
jgi:hypothetical protein